MKTCNFVKAPRILSGMYGKLSGTYEEVKEPYPCRIPPGKFGELGKKRSECSSRDSGSRTSLPPNSSHCVPSVRTVIVMVAEMQT